MGQVNARRPPPPRPHERAARSLSRVEKNALTNAIRLLIAEADSMHGYPAEQHRRATLYRHADVLNTLRYEGEPHAAR